MEMGGGGGLEEGKWKTRRIGMAVYLSDWDDSWPEGAGSKGASDQVGIQVWVHPHLSFPGWLPVQGQWVCE
jgi:hypothetical protein